MTPFQRTFVKSILLSLLAGFICPLTLFQTTMLFVALFVPWLAYEVSRPPKEMPKNHWRTCKYYDPDEDDSP